MWAVQAKLLGGLLGGLLLSIIRSSPSTHTHASTTCMYACIGISWLLSAAAIQVARLGPPLLAPASRYRQQSRAMKLFTALLALQVVPTPPNPTAHI